MDLQTNGTDWLHENKLLKSISFFRRERETSSKRNNGGTFWKWKVRGREEEINEIGNE